MIHVHTYSMYVRTRFCIGCIQVGSIQNVHVSLNGLCLQWVVGYQCLLHMLMHIACTLLCVVPRAHVVLSCSMYAEGCWYINTSRVV